MTTGGWPAETRAPAADMPGGIKGRYDGIHEFSEVDDTDDLGKFPHVRYEMSKSAQQRELSRIGCAEIEADGLGSYRGRP
jgi:hypothetical protein